MFGQILCTDSVLNGNEHIKYGHDKLVQQIWRRWAATSFSARFTTGGRAALTHALS